MDYFLLKQDKRCSYVPRILDWFNKVDLRHLNLMDADKIKDEMIFYVNSESNNNYFDILDNQLFLVSEEMKKILEKCDPNIIFKMAVLTDFNNSKQNIYYLPIFEEIEALSEDAEMNLNKTVVKKLILNEDKIKNKKVFKLKESSKSMVIVRLDVAESILRRDFNGLELEKVEIRSE
ncbi:DUF1629 domain-containing protein [Clostridium sp.]|uniref:imm11 family protein n=1 Tax=Clostridium sp. TaxID=1506 RepID=UPI002628C1BF|nr:DUF1629 domain-containing protein [Clostridium sp.]